MNTVIFVLGFVSALVVILIAAVVVIMLKMKGVKQVEERLTRNLEEVQSNLHQQILDEINVRHQQITNEINVRHQETEEMLRQANSYTDRRFDKISPNKDVSILADLVETAKKDGNGQLIISFAK